MFEVKTVARRAVLIGALGGLALSSLLARAQDRREMMGPLRIHPENPRYFTDGSGRAIYLTGSHTWANLQDQGPKDPPRPFDYEGYLDFLRERNHNVIRLWAWEQARWAPWSDGKGQNPSDWFISPNPYARTGPGMALDGKPKFDLEKWDDAYFDRLRTRVRQAGERGIYVSVMLFQGWSSAKSWLGGTPWRGHPYHPENNIQGWSGNTKGDSGPALDDPRVRERQAAYIRKVIDTLNDLDNVLYEVTNEGGYKDWDRFVVETVHAYEKAKPKQHPVGLTGHGSENNDEMLASPADWFSPGSSQWPDLKTDPRAVAGKKVSLLDTDHVFGVGGDQKWVWKAFLQGPQRALHGPVRRPRLGTDPRRPGGGRARRRGVPSRDGHAVPLRRAHRPRLQPAGRRAGLDRILPGGPRAGVPGLPPRRRRGDRGPLGCQGQTRRGVVAPDHG